MAIECHAGTTQQFPAATFCQECPVGTFVPPASTGMCSTFNCQPGSIDHDLNASTPCNDCARGSYAPEGDYGECKPCGVGTVDHDSNASTQCELCPDGTHNVPGTFGSCIPCPAGTSDEDRNPATACTSCGSGAYAPPGSAGACSTHQCAEGYTDADYRAETPCVFCEAGTYVPAGSSGACGQYNCPANTVDHDSDPSTRCQVNNGCAGVKLSDEEDSSFSLGVLLAGTCGGFVLGSIVGVLIAYIFFNSGGSGTAAMATPQGVAKQQMQMGVYAADPLFQPQPDFVASPNTQMVYAQQMGAMQPAAGAPDEDDAGYTHYDAMGRAGTQARAAAGGDIMY